MQEDPGLIPGSGKSPGEGNGYPLQYSRLENSMARHDVWSRGPQRVGHDSVINNFTFKDSVEKRGWDWGSEQNSHGCPAPTVASVDSGDH